MSSGSNRLPKRSTVSSVIRPAGSITQTAHGFSPSAFTILSSDPTAVAPSSASFSRGLAFASKTTHSCPAFIRRRAMLPPIRPSPIMPICICFTPKWVHAVFLTCASCCCAASSTRSGVNPNFFAKAIGVPGWPELACCTASIDSVRIVLMQRSSIERWCGDEPRVAVGAGAAGGDAATDTRHFAGRLDVFGLGQAYFWRDLDPPLCQSAISRTVQPLFRSSTRDKRLPDKAVESQ
jgi:hypothetical protein